MADRTSNASQSAAAFKRGVRLVAGMVEEIWSQGDDVWIEIADRGGNVPQNTDAVKRSLDALAQDPDAMDGFLAALTSFIAPTGYSSWGGDISFLRGLEYAECVERPAPNPISIATEVRHD